MGCVARLGQTVSRVNTSLTVGGGYNQPAQSGQYNYPGYSAPVSEGDEYEIYDDDEFYEEHYDDAEEVIYEDYPGLQSLGALCDSNHFLCQSQTQCITLSQQLTGSLTARTDPMRNSAENSSFTVQF